MKKHAKVLRILMVLAAAVLFSLLCWLLWAFVPRSSVRYSLLAVTGGIFVLAGLWIWFWQKQIFHFADEICDTLDALISGRQPEVERPYEDSITAKVQGKLLQYYDIMNEGKLQSQRDKQTIQELVSDISHQVKTPMANIRMFTDILLQQELPFSQIIDGAGLTEDCECECTYALLNAECRPGGESGEDAYALTLNLLLRARATVWRSSSLNSSMPRMAMMSWSSRYFSRISCTFRATR